jgi:hypothetical protein
MSSQAVADQDVRVVSAQSCPSITGKSTLTYHLGMAGTDPQIRIHGNSGPGYFNPEWVSVARVLESLPKVGPFTSFVLRSAFKGRSLNSRSFLMAALRNEGVVRRSTERPRCWERGDVEGFLARVGGVQPQQPPGRKPASRRSSKPSSPTGARSPAKAVPKGKK